MFNNKEKILLIKECIGWDCVNWSQSINYFEQHVDFNKVEKALELGIGYMGGGYSLYLASRNIKVISSDYKGVSDKVKAIHKQYKFSDLIAMGNDGYEWTTGYCNVNQLVEVKSNSDDELYIIRGDNQWLPNNYSIVTLSNAYPGDLNFDQTINIGDVVIMIEHITEINIIDNLHKSLLADINLDEIINITDIIINIEYILNN